MKDNENNEKSLRDKRIRSLAILAGLAFMALICFFGNLGRDKKEVDTPASTDYFSSKMDEALDTLLSAHFLDGTTVISTGTIEEFSPKTELEETINNLKTRLSVYKDMPEEYISEQLKKKMAELNRRLDSLETRYQEMPEGTSSSHPRVRRVTVRQPNGDRFTAFQKIDGKCTSSTLTGIMTIE